MWGLIETAPKERGLLCKPILLWPSDCGEVFEGWWDDPSSAWVKGRDRYADFSKPEHYHEHPSHWQHMPEPPQ